MQQVTDVAPERLEAGVRSLGPEVWDFADE